MVPHCELVDETDDLLTLQGLRLIWERNQVAQPEPVGRALVLHDSWELGGVTIPNRVVLAPLAGIGNWFVRLQAKRYGAGLAVSEMVSSFAIHYGNRKTHDELLHDRPARARGRAGGDPALRAGPGDHALGRRARGGRRAPT